jgi:hypothetical protein
MGGGGGGGGFGGRLGGNTGVMSGSVSGTQMKTPAPAPALHPMVQQLVNHPIVQGVISRVLNRPTYPAPTPASYVPQNAIPGMLQNIFSPKISYDRAPYDPSFAGNTFNNNVVLGGGQVGYAKYGDRVAPSNSYNSYSQNNDSYYGR